MIGQTISHYKITAKLGSGGMGEVYLATDTNLDRQVAVKFLSADRSGDPEARQRFIHEAKAQAMLSHPNIATFHDVGEEKGRAFLVMEYVDGHPLPVVAHEEKLSLPEILDLVIQVAKGLQAAHEHGVVHRDIKPENILVTPKRQVKITDFGLARWKGATTLTKSGTRLGTAYYMSPEQAEGKRVDHRSDVFSLGVVLYELLCNQRPFEGETEPVILYELTSKSPAPLARYRRDVTDGLERIVSKCLAKNPEERYQSCADLVGDLRREQKASEAVGATVAPPVVQRRRGRGLVISGSAVAAIALVLFVLKPWQIEVRPTKEAAANENSLAVMYFNNLVDATDRDKTAQMVTSLLITGLSESQYLRVVSRQRLYDILNLFGKAGVTSIDRNTASQVAEKAGVRWIVTGDIFQTQPRIVLKAEVSNAATGDIVTTQRVTGESGDDLFAVVDKLSAAVRRHLSLPEQAKTEPTRPVADVTTHSPEAYRFYLEGLDWDSKYDITEARQSFQKALSFDSTFAMAYYRLAELSYATRPEQRDCVARAMKYSERATWKEQRYIKAQALDLGGTPAKAIEELQKIVERYPDEKDAYQWMGKYYEELGLLQRAASQFEKVVAIDPMYKEAYNYLVYMYDGLGDFEKSLWAINQYISLAPDEANPYDTRGDLYAWNGKIDEAIDSYKKALQIKPDFSILDLGILYIFKREYALAESTFQVMIGSAEKETRSQGRAYLCLLPAYQGQFARAQAIIEDGLAADRLERCESWAYLLKLHSRVVLDEARGNFVSALAQLERLRAAQKKADLGDSTANRAWPVELLADQGDLARARELAQGLRRDIEKSDSSFMYQYWYAEGCIALVEGRIDEAIAEFEKSVPPSVSFSFRYQLARAYLQRGSLDKAVVLLEKVLSRYDRERALDPYRSVMCHYLLGTAYERSGWKAKAIEQYKTFLDIWKDADPGIKEIDDARARLTRLTS